MTKIMYVGKHATVDIPTLEEKSPGRIGRGQGADVDPALADELLKTPDWEPAREQYVPVVKTVEEAERANEATAHLELAAKKAKEYDPQASVKAFVEGGGEVDVAHAPTPVVETRPIGEEAADLASRGKAHGGGGAGALETAELTRNSKKA
jgi:hypothetical protein